MQALIQQTQSVPPLLVSSQSLPWPHIQGSGESTKDCSREEDTSYQRLPHDYKLVHRGSEMFKCQFPYAVDAFTYPHTWQLETTAERCFGTLVCLWFFGCLHAYSCRNKNNTITTFCPLQRGVPNSGTSGILSVGVVMRNPAVENNVAMQNFPLLYTGREG